VRGYYAYVPLSRSLAGDRVVLHQNTGWLYQRAGDEASFRGRHALTWAARADVALGGRRRGGGGSPPWRSPRRTGLREPPGRTRSSRSGSGRSPRPDAVQVDLSYGGFLRARGFGRRAAGWTLGLTLTTPPFL
jgi:hypothetical protein